MGDTGPHLELEWLARRRDGESVALIAWRDGVSQGRVRRVTDPFDAYAGLDVAEDGGHAFYLGVELARAEIAWQLGKRYVQDNRLRWGVAVDPPAEESTHLKAAGATLPARRRRAEES